MVPQPLSPLSTPKSRRNVSLNPRTPSSGVQSSGITIMADQLKRQSSLTNSARLTSLSQSALTTSSVCPVVSPLRLVTPIGLSKSAKRTSSANSSSARTKSVTAHTATRGMWKTSWQLRPVFYPSGITARSKKPSPLPPRTFLASVSASLLARTRRLIAAFRGLGSTGTSDSGQRSREN